MNEVIHWRYYNVKDPLGAGFLGMAVCRRKDGTETTLHTVDGSGNMETFMYPGEAEVAIKAVIDVMHKFTSRIGKPPISKRECGKRLEAFHEENERFHRDFMEDDDDVV